MRKVKLSTAYGRKLYARGSNYDAYTLEQIYDSYSASKRSAYEWCYEQYLKSDDASAFSIISHNRQGFSVSWLCTLDGHNGMRIETPFNSYFIDFDE